MPGGKGCPMKKSKNKYSPWPAVALCLVFLALRIVDQALFTDPETSFPTVGPSAARWGDVYKRQIQYYLRFWLGICRTSLAVSALRIMRYCHKWQKEQEEQAMNITVYLGAKEGNDQALKRAVQELGQWIGQSGNALVLSLIHICYDCGLCGRPCGKTAADGIQAAAIGIGAYQNSTAISLSLIHI